MGRHQQLAQPAPVAGLQCAHELPDAIDLGTDVASAAGIVGLCLPPALVVGRVRQPAPDAGVDDGDHQVVGECDQAVLEGGAVEQETVARPAQGGRELVHHAHQDTSRRLLGALAGERCRHAAEVGPQPRRQRHQQRRRGAQAGARRDVRAHQHPVRPALQLSAEGLHIAQAPRHVAVQLPNLGWLAARLDEAVHGAWQDQAAHVVHVLPDQVDPPRRSRGPAHEGSLPCPRRGRRG